jgi:hypothetical protein
MKTKIRLFFSILLFSLMILITSCNNIFLDDLIDKNITLGSNIPVTDGIIIDGAFLDWGNIPVMLKDENDGLNNGDILEVKIAINSARTQLYFYIRTASTITVMSEAYVVSLSNDLECDGKRFSAFSNLFLWGLCDNSAYIPLPYGSSYPNWPLPTPAASGSQIEFAIVLLDTGNGVNLGPYFPQNDRLYLSVYSVLTTTNAVYPINDTVNGKWIWFKPQ